ncbi:Fatty-acid peroxygenase [Oceanobacillus picturae]|uniref:Fatty-acid peroxygenase n=1 Tax=Oceanobacillus picturae TaxID=171693 RepID=W9ANX6_9BACI|nr:cytochrome P450 [Oceanobacillus picturae]CDO04562.1 Fatty-acid peroxygenase [Oceanobacillus picturae]
MNSGNQIPTEKGMDHSVALLREGYRFVPNRLQRFRSDIFQTRMMGGQKALCISGKQAAELFYDNERFKRQGAAPKRIKESLFGVGGVQGMDGESHRHRKHLFMSLMTKESLKKIAAICRGKWQQSATEWETMDSIELFPEAEKIMCRTACEWVGVPLWAKDLSIRTKDLSDMIDAFGAAGPRHWKGRVGRNRAEKWIRDIVERVRNDELYVEETKPLYVVAWHRDLDGNLLDTQTAAVEILNLLRPIVAIARFVTFGALALYDFPQTREKLTHEDGQYVKWFVQEIRRYYPFAPFTGALTAIDFDWQGYHFKKDTLVILDIYGTNHSPELWTEPNRFKPERFKDWQGSPFDFIPQGGGDYDKGHRCAGEWLTIELMQTSLTFLTQDLTYEVPPQDLTYSMTRIPTHPKSNFIMENIRVK